MWSLGSSVCKFQIKEKLAPVCYRRVRVIALNLKGASVEGMHGPPRDMSSDKARSLGTDRPALL